MIKKPEVIRITGEDLVKNGFYYKVIFEKGKVIRIIIENKKKMVNDCFRNIRKLGDHHYDYSDTYLFREGNDKEGLR